MSYTNCVRLRVPTRAVESKQVEKLQMKKYVVL